jgi:acetate kinase
MQILAINTGSSSVRLAWCELEEGVVRMVARRRYEERSTEPLASFAEDRHFDAVVHRVVHGGERLRASLEIDAHVEAEIARLSALAPLHNPVALDWIGAAKRRYPRAKQVAAFDTAFFAQLPDVATTYAVPRRLARELGLRRYGFHGLAHHAMWRAFSRQRPPQGGRRRLISLQLGSGCSIAAVADGRPLDTSMGMTPLEGLVMATRSGDLDPGVVLQLQREGGLSTSAVARLLDEEAGLLGVSDLSGDLRVLLASPAFEAKLAIDLYCYRARKYIGAYLSVLHGAEAIAFGGGAGEHQPEIRARILSGMEWAGIGLDPALNQRADGGLMRISRAESAIEVWVVPVDEETALAEEAVSVLKGR